VVITYLSLSFLLHWSAGPSGFVLAYGLGFFVKGSAAWSDSHLMDSIPGDTAASVVIAASAAAGVLLNHSAGGEDNRSNYLQKCDELISPQLLLSNRAQADHAGGQHGGTANRGHALLIVHAASSTTNPLFNQEARMVS
jgi:hypothetical protein